jgi:hypothetical protein
MKTARIGPVMYSQTKPFGPKSERLGQRARFCLQRTFYQNEPPGTGCFYQQRAFKTVASPIP